MGLISWLFKRKKEKPIKLGLALGSGGAKGFAELGALKALEENGVQFDIVAGTSIGSIIGAFYANGYSSVDIMEMMKSVDMSDIKTFFMINMDTLGMFKVIDKFIGSLNIEDLKKPFRAIATETATATEKVFDSGSVAKALCASASYPPFFKPVEIDGKQYVDGAFMNSVPCDVVRKLGADFVLGIDLANHESKSGVLSKLLPSFNSPVKEPWQKGYANADVMLHPNLTQYKAVSFGMGVEMYEIGYNTAMEKMPEILAKIGELKHPKKQKKSKKKKSE